jgi:nitroimidazol reductase NimA-like FMN-containing flavoprotein (pyridoxamine 5'-phosphate oxidase superfamily)
MQASIGDRIIIKSHHVGEPDRDAEILEVHGQHGAPPYVVRWSDDGHEGVFFPGPDATLQHFASGESALVPCSETDDKEGRELSLTDCLDLLDAHQVGRIAILTDAGPVIVPVNYRLVRAPDLNWIAFRTRLGGILDRTSLHAAFEIDHIDDTHRTGWSVLVRGTLQHVDPDAADFGGRYDSEPWVVDRDTWMIIQPFRIEGRRLEPRATSRRQRS